MDDIVSPMPSKEKRKGDWSCPTKGGGAMQTERKGLISLKTWLCSPKVSGWAEGLTEGIFFSLIAWGVWKIGGN